MNDFLQFDILKPTSNTKPDQNIEEVILECNKIAMDHLKNGRFNDALDLLRKAEGILTTEYQANPNEKTYRLIGITLNNLGCYYKRTNMPKVALKYLKKALQIEIFTLNDKANVAGTHLNICAILSSMNQHHEAIKHVKLAIELLELAKTENANDNPDLEPDISVSQNETERNIKQKHKTIITTMIIAYYNFGTELEFLKEYQKSVQAFSKGYHLALKELGPENQLTNTLYQNMLNLAEKNKIAESQLQKKSENLLRNLEANRYIRYRPGCKNNHNFTIVDHQAVEEKSIEYGYDGRRKIVKTKRAIHSVSPSTRNFHPPLYSAKPKISPKTRLEPIRIASGRNSELRTVDEVNETMFITRENNNQLPPLDMSAIHQQREREFSDYRDSYKGNHSHNNSLSQTKELDRAAFQSLDNEIHEIEQKINQTMNDINKISLGEDPVNRTVSYEPISKKKPPLNNSVNKPKSNLLPGYGQRTNFANRRPANSKTTSSSSIKDRDAYLSSEEASNPGKSDVSYGRSVSNPRSQANRKYISKSNPRPSKNSPYNNYPANNSSHSNNDYLKVKDVYEYYRPETQETDKLIEMDKSFKTFDYNKPIKDTSNQKLNSDTERTGEEPLLELQKRLQEYKSQEKLESSPGQHSKDGEDQAFINDKAKMKNYMKYFE